MTLINKKIELIKLAIQLMTLRLDLLPTYNDYTFSRKWPKIRENLDKDGIIPANNLLNSEENRELAEIRALIGQYIGKEPKPLQVDLLRNKITNIQKIICEKIQNLTL